MRRKRRKYIVRKFQTTRYRESFLFKNFIFLVMLTFTVIFLLSALKNYRELDNYGLGSAKKTSEDLSGFRVRILNSSGDPDLADLLAAKLKEYNVEPLIERLPGEYSRTPTMIINRSGDANRVQKLASLLNCSNVVSKIERNDNVDAIIIIGKDLRTLRR